MPQESPEILKLRDEFARLKQKCAETKDRDILAVLNMRIKEIEEPTLPPLPVTGAEQPESEEVVQLRAELVRLKAKLAQTTDRDIIAVLEMRINQVEPLLPANRGAGVSIGQTDAAAPSEVKEEEVAPVIPLPSPEQADKAEQLIRQSMLEKRRGNKVEATDLLKKAVEAAPGSPTVLEALGDDYVERRMMKEAREVYKRTLQSSTRRTLVSSVSGPKLCSKGSRICRLKTKCGRVTLCSCRVATMSPASGRLASSLRFCPEWARWSLDEP